MLGQCSCTHCTGRTPEAGISPRALRPGFHSSAASSRPLLNFSRKLFHVEGLSSLLSAHAYSLPPHLMLGLIFCLLFFHFSLKCLFSLQKTYPLVETSCGPPMEILSFPYDSLISPPFQIHSSLCLFTLKLYLFF